MKKPDYRFRRDLRTKFIRNTVRWMNCRQMQRAIQQRGWLHWWIIARALAKFEADWIDRMINGSGSGEPQGIIRSSGEVTVTADFTPGEGYADFLRENGKEVGEA